MATNVHPSAHVDDGARLGADVTVGPHAVIEADVTIGDRCRIMPGAIVGPHTEMGPDNVVGPYCVLGGAPQDVKFDPARVTHLRIGAGNLFREYVTLNRATAEGAATVVGDRCFFMTQSHAGHESVVGDDVILTNNTAVGGHAEIGQGVYLSGNTMVHQFCWVGELAMLRGRSGVSQHVPPFCMAVETNRVVGLNVVGLRRAPGVTREDREQIKQAYRLLYRSGLTPERALAEMDARDDWRAPAGRFRQFVRRVLAADRPYRRGLITERGHRDDAGA